METLRTEPFQVVFLDQEGKCFTYHNVSGDVSACDIQAENLVHNIMAKGVLLNNISEENGSSHLQSKGVIPIGQVAGFGEQVAEQVAGFGEQVAEQVAGFGEQVAGFGEWVCSSVDFGFVGVIGAVLGALGTTIALESLGWLAGTTSIVKMAVLTTGIVGTGFIAFVVVHDGVKYVCEGLSETDTDADDIDG